MHCKTVRKNLVMFLEGVIQPELRNMIKGHLSSCGDCQREYEIQVEARTTLRAVPSVSKPEFFWSVLQERINQHLTGTGIPDRKGIRKVPFFFKEPRIRFAATLALIIIALGSLFWGGKFFFKEQWQATTGVPNGEEIEFYLEEHDLSQGGLMSSQSAFAGTIIQTEYSSDKKHKK